MPEYWNTIKEPCIIEGTNTQPKIIGKITPPIIKCKPNNSLWIRFTRDGGKSYISLWPKTLQAVSSFSARFLQIFDHEKKNSKINIVEHLISCLMALRITDIDIETTKRVPVAGAWFSGYHNVLKDKVIPNPNRILNNIQLNHGSIDAFPLREKLANGMIRSVNWNNISYSKMEKWLERKISIEPANSLIIEVVNGKHGDVMDLEEKSFKVDFRDKEEWFEKHMWAKPIGRVHKILPYTLLRVFSKITRSKAIGPANYTMIYPGSTKEKVWNRMGEKYKEDHNEYLAHTAISDLPAELKVALQDLWWVTVDCKITLSNTNHLYRMEWIKQIIEDQLFTNVPPIQ